MSAAIKVAKVIEGAGAVLLARVVGNAGTPITQASLSSISRLVYVPATATSVSSGTLTISSVVYDALQTGDLWAADSEGYNFKDTIGASTLSEGNTVYRVEYKFTPTSGEVFKVLFDLTTVESYAD